MQYICKQCKKVFDDCPASKRQFCSKGCFYISRKGENLITKPCVVCGKLFDSYPVHDRKYCSPLCYWKAKLGTKQTNETRLKRSMAEKGEKHYNWQNGKTKANKLARIGIEYRLWREAVFARDGWKCQQCGNGGVLEAHHIKGFAQYPELRFAIDNGVTLCKKCHKGTDNYAHKAQLIY